MCCVSIIKIAAWYSTGYFETSVPSLLASTYFLLSLFSIPFLPLHFLLFSSIFFPPLHKLLCSRSVIKSVKIDLILKKIWRKWRQYQRSTPPTPSILHHHPHAAMYFFALDPVLHSSSTPRNFPLYLLELLHHIQQSLRFSIENFLHPLTWNEIWWPPLQPFRVVFIFSVLKGR